VAGANDLSPVDHPLGQARQIVRATPGKRGDVPAASHQHHLTPADLHKTRALGGHFGDKADIDELGLGRQTWQHATSSGPALVEPPPNHSRGDVHLLNVDGAAGNPPTPGISQPSFHRVFLGVTVTAHQLDRISRYLA